jgi:hypothetical protein
MLDDAFFGRAPRPMTSMAGGLTHG